MPSRSHSPVIFLSYRKLGGIGHAANIRRGLEQCFGKDAVFQDNFSIASEKEWDRSVPQGIRKAKIFLALVHGDDWFTNTKTSNEYRDNSSHSSREDDWVLKEIRLALERKMLLIPILLAGVSNWPKDKAGFANAGPADIALFFEKQCQFFDQDHFEVSLQQLAALLTPYINEKKETTVPPSGGHIGKKKHDIFLSYSHLDRERVSPLVKALEEKGWSVWWDRKIPIGETFDEFIEQNLASSRIVVVVWSKHSVQSRWVRTEANEGLVYNILVPLLIDSIKPPLAFRMIQTADLSGWDGNRRHVEFEKVSDAVKMLLNISPIASPGPYLDIYTDTRDGQVYPTVELNGLTWMARNLNYNIGEGTWFYDSNPENGEKYGRLYTWQAAQRACPPGWRLPKDEEWKTMIKHLGGYYDLEEEESIGDPGKAFNALIKADGHGLSVTPSGLCYTDGSFSALGSHAAFWSVTETGVNKAWAYSFHQKNGKLYRLACSKSMGLSCRYVRS